MSQNGNPQGTQSLTIARKDSMKRLSSMIENSRTQEAFAKIATRYLTPDRLIKVGLQAFSRQPELLDCTPQSLLLAFLQAAEVGLEFGSAKREAYLVPRRNKNLQGVMEATFLPSYIGLVTVARRSGEIVDVEARIVHERDEFEVDYGESKLTHRPHRGADHGPVIAAWARATWKSGHQKFEVLWKDDIESIRKSSAQPNGFGWSEWYEEMAKKSAVRRLYKLLPKTDDLALAEDMAGGDVDAKGRYGAIIDVTAGNVIDIDQAGGRDAGDRGPEAA